MKITVNRHQFLSAFTVAAGVAPKRSPKPIIQNVKVDALDGHTRLLATDLEISVRLTVEGVTIEQSGSAILSPQRFGAICRESADEQLTVTATAAGKLTVSGAHSKFNLTTESPDEFPLVQDFNEQRYYEISVASLRDAVKRTVFATDEDSTRYALGGVLLEFHAGNGKMIAVASDGRRLTKCECPCLAVGDAAEPNHGQTVIPARAMLLAAKAFADAEPDATVKIAVFANFVLFHGHGATLYARLLDGRFPKWQDVIPKVDGDWTRATSAVGPCYAAVRQAAITASAESGGIDFRLDNANDAGLLTLSCTAADVGESRVELPVACTGAGGTVSLNHHYVSDFLRAIPSDAEFSMEMLDSQHGVVFRLGGDEFVYIAMPLA